MSATSVFEDVNELSDISQRIPTTASALPTRTGLSALVRALIRVRAPCAGVVQGGATLEVGEVALAEVEAEAETGAVVHVWVRVLVRARAHTHTHTHTHTQHIPCLPAHFARHVHARSIVILRSLEAELRLYSYSRISLSRTTSSRRLRT